MDWSYDLLSDEERRVLGELSVFAGTFGLAQAAEVSGGDPGYTETAVMLSESAMSLAFDDNPPTAGQVTTAVAMGDNLIDRLVKAGIAFTVHRDG